MCAELSLGWEQGCTTSVWTDWTETETEPMVPVRSGLTMILCMSVRSYDISRIIGSVWSRSKQLGLIRSDRTGPTYCSMISCLKNDFKVSYHATYQSSNFTHTNVFRHQTCNRPESPPLLVVLMPLHLIPFS